MINVALGFIKISLDQYLVNTYGLGSSVVVLNSLVDVNGSPHQLNQNKIVVTLINLEWETNQKSFGLQRRENDQFSQFQPSVSFNLDVLISANFDDYAEALRLLTAVIYFFQANPIINRANSPDLPNGLVALKFEIENSSYGKSFELWSALGAKYQPSIIYKIRQVTIQSADIQNTTPVIRNVD